MNLIRLASLALIIGSVPSVIPANDPPHNPAQAKPKAADEGSKFRYRGLTIDVGALADSPDRDSSIAALRNQIDMVVDAKVKPEVANFFLTVPVELGFVPDGQLGVCRDHSVFLTSEPIPVDRGVLIHELTHAYHQMKLTDDHKRQVTRFHKEATRSYGLSSNEYFLSNESEFFAVTASISLRGRSSRLPHTRQILKAVQPDYYKLLGAMFDPKPADPS